MQSEAKDAIETNKKKKKIEETKKL